MATEDNKITPKTDVLAACFFFFLFFFPAPAQSRPVDAEARLLIDVQHRAFRFFWEKADPDTGLINDRARNSGADPYRIASIASTGYGLAALPVGIAHGWIKRTQGKKRALRTLRFLVYRMPQKHGWYFHFVDRRTGRRVWKCELSSMDTGLLIIGALTCGQYFPRTEVQRLANRLYDRIDWTWMRTNGGRQPRKLLLAHGWTPEHGFLPHNWNIYCESILLYLLGMGAKRDRLPAACWTAWSRQIYRYGGISTLTGGPLFLHQMPEDFYDFEGLRDRQGYDYWVSSVNATYIHRKFCLDRVEKRHTYRPDLWGLNASDGPGGYIAYGVPGPEDGTVSPTGVIASLSFAPELCRKTTRAFYDRYRPLIWGRYGFADAFNVDAAWYDGDVIGIDLGMALLAIENRRSRLLWHLLKTHPSTRRAFAAAGFHTTHEHRPRLLLRAVSPKRAAY